MTVATEDHGPVDPDGVTTSVVTLTDTSRSTPAAGSRPAEETRVLDTHLYEPSGEGPFPLVVFAHGLNGHPRKFTDLHRAWAAAGYVVAAPVFPLSNDENPGGGDVRDLREQPGDLSFVLDRLLDGDSPLRVNVDAARIGAGGLSLGGATVYGMVYDACCRDPRVAAAMVLDGNELAFSPDLSSGPPLFIAHAEGDTALPYDNAARHFAVAAVPAAFLTLHEVAHAEPYENTPDPADELVELVTVAWWDRHLGGDHGALGRVEAAVVAAGSLATWEDRLG